MQTRDGALAGRYALEEEVGRGGMARVYRATDTVLRLTVAVKVLAEEFASDPTFVERLRREARAAARLRLIRGQRAPHWLTPVTASPF